MTFTDTYTDIYHDTYGEPVSVVTPPAIPPAPGSLWSVLLRDADYTYTGRLTYTQLDIRLRHNALSSWVLDIPYDGNTSSLPAGLLVPGSGVVFTYNGKNVLSGPMTSATRNRDADGSHILQVAGTDDLQLVADRLGNPEPLSATPPYDSHDHDAHAGLAEDVVKQFLFLNLGAFATTDRQQPVFIAPSLGRGTTVTCSVRFDPLLDCLTKAAEQGGLGLKAIQTSQGVVTLDVYEPADKTASVVFADTLHNIRSYSFEIQRPTATWVVVAGSGEGTSRVILEDGIVSDWGRIEFFRDQRQTADLGEMQMEADTVLNEQGDRFALSAELVDRPDGPFRWAPAITQSGQEGYDRGDVVTIVIDGEPLEQTIREIQVTDSQAGTTITPIVGTPGQSDPRERWISEVFARIAAQQAQIVNLERAL